MARAPALGSLSGLRPWSGGSADFGSFNVGAASRQSYLAFRQSEIDYKAGKISDDAYLAAMQTYASSLKVGSSERLSADADLTNAKYTIGRNKLIAAAQDGSGQWSALVTFDQAHLATMTDKNSETYRDALQKVHEAQVQAFAVDEEKKAKDYQDGKITATALADWYSNQMALPAYAENDDLLKRAQDQVTALGKQAQADRDQKTVGDFNAGKMAYGDFITYATGARARYASGTDEARQWDDYIANAKSQAAERPLAYRYNLSQQWEQLSQFVQTNSQPPQGSYRKGTTRVVLGANGKWTTVKEGAGYAGPSAAEQAAYKNRLIEVQSAKAQMAAIARQITGQGGYVTTDSMLSFYRQQQTQYVKGTNEWYTVQERIDSLNERKANEDVLSKQGIVLTFGSGSAGRPVVVGGAGRTGGGGSASSTKKPSITAGTPASSPKGPLERVTGAVDGEYLTSSVQLPKGLGATAFEDFYSGFRTAFTAGKDTWTDASTGTTYFIPHDVAARAAMMEQLDNTRLSLRAYQAAVYAGTAKEITAHDAYSTALQDKAENTWTVSDTLAKNPGSLEEQLARDPTRWETQRTTIAAAAAKGAAVSVAGAYLGNAQDTPSTNPIAVGADLVAKAKKYADDELKAANDCFDRGDLTGAWAHLALVTKTLTQVDDRIQNIYGPLAQQQAAVLSPTGAKMPAGAKTDFDSILNWADEAGSIKTGMTKLQGNLATVTVADGDGNPHLNQDGQVDLKPGYVRVLDAKGKVSIAQKPITTAAPGQTGASDQWKDHVLLKVNVGGSANSVVSAYADTKGDVVGYIAGTTKEILGRTVQFANPTTGQPEKWVEDPFHPGHWSKVDADKGQQLMFQAPPGLQVVPNPSGDLYMWQKDGAYYALQWNAKDGTYHVMRGDGADLGRVGDTTSTSPGSPAPADIVSNWGTDYSNWGAANMWSDREGISAGFTSEQMADYQYAATFSDRAAGQAARASAGLTPGGVPTLTPLQMTKFTPEQLGSLAAGQAARAGAGYSPAGVRTTPPMQMAKYTPTELGALAKGQAGMAGAGISASGVVLGRPTPIATGTPATAAPILAKATPLPQMATYTPTELSALAKGQAGMAAAGITPSGVPTVAPPKPAAATPVKPKATPKPKPLDTFTRTATRAQ